MNWGGIIITAVNNCIAAIRDISSMALVKEMKAGWNLGNSLDVNRYLPKSNNPSEYETYWGNPVVKKEIIDNIKNAGFNIIRIPISWGEHTDESDEFLIDDVWFNRVKEVIDYAIDNNTYVIINIHHEEWLVPLNADYEFVSDKFSKIWNQIAEYFKDYDEHLLFQSMNEPRLKGTDIEWTDGSQEARDIINKLNARFVSIVRSTGGNNKLRHLIITGYCSSIHENVLRNILLPEDDKLIVSTHVYKPYEFSLKSDGTDIWNNDTSADIDEIIQIYNNFKHYFTDKGIPVIIDECGNVNKSNIHARSKHIGYLVNTFKKLNIPCIWWDNGVFNENGEKFGIINRLNGEWYFPEIAEAMLQNCF